VTIPARPYLFLVSSDLVEIEATIADMLIAEWDRA
jgi:phage gpG-like protein